MINYSGQDVVSYLVEWINDITIHNLNRKYVYAGDDIGSNLGPESRSYIQGQILISKELDRIYISYVLDPNIIWNNPDQGDKLYDIIDDYILKAYKKTALKSTTIEILHSDQSRTELHEKHSRCRSSESNTYLYNDTVGIWKSIDGNYSFIRDNSILYHNKRKLYVNESKQSFQDWVDIVRNLNNVYYFKQDNNNVQRAFINDYRNLYYSYFGSYPIDASDGVNITKFYLLDWTDFSIYHNNKKINNTEPSEPEQENIPDEPTIQGYIIEPAVFMRVNNDDTIESNGNIVINFNDKPAYGLVPRYNIEDDYIHMDGRIFLNPQMSGVFLARYLYELMDEGYTTIHYNLKFENKSGSRIYGTLHADLLFEGDKYYTIENGETVYDYTVSAPLSILTDYGIYDSAEIRGSFFIRSYDYENMYNIDPNDISLFTIESIEDYIYASLTYSFTKE